MQVLKLILLSSTENTTNFSPVILLLKIFIAICLYNPLYVQNSGVISCESNYFSKHFIENDIKVSSVTVEKSDFLINCAKCDFSYVVNFL